jgi:hypothetical protein
MRTLTTRIIPVTLAIVLVAGFSGPARANPPTAASGVWKLVSHSQAVLGTAHGKTYISVVEMPSYSGGLTGAALDTYTVIAEANGRFTVPFGVETCSPCTIGGRTGGFTAVFTFSGSGTQGRGRLTFINGTGGLTGLHGDGTFQGGNGSGTYTYNYSYK